MIIGKNISKTFTGDPVLKNIDFKILNYRKIGVVGRNGCGKTTLFNLIAGMDTPTTGSIDSHGEKVGYITQELNFPNELVGNFLEQHIGDVSNKYKIDKLVTAIEFVNFNPHQKISTLSEGQKLKLKIIEMSLKEPTILLIDEPTNHLDIEGIMWFESYIKNLDKTVLMISHDREFLNNTVDEIWEIEQSRILRFVGDYDNYKEEKLKLVDKWNEEYVRFIKRKKQLQTLLERSRVMKTSRSGKGVQAVKKKIEREIINNKKEKYVSHKMQGVNFDTSITANKLMIEFEQVSKAYDNNTIFSNLSFEVRGGDKMWLFGQNGIGKTTIIKMVVGEEKPTSGTVKIGNNIKIGYFAQKQTHLDYTQNIFEYFISQTGCYYGDAFGFLKKFLFEKEELQKKIRDLSPGQRARFAFAIFAYKDYDLLVLDEPTNHLDIETKEVIEESLKNYKGTLLLVSHDRYFVERIGMTKLLNLREGREV